MNPEDLYVPSDDGMSDILHNAGHAYAMYLDENGKEDINMSLDQGQLVCTLRLADTEIVQSVELAYHHFSYSLASTEHNVNVYYSICLYDFQSCYIRLQYCHRIQKSRSS